MPSAHSQKTAISHTLKQKENDNNYKHTCCVMVCTEESLTEAVCQTKTGKEAEKLSFGNAFYPGARRNREVL